MGSFIEINDTLQLTTEQGFPAELDLEKHKIKEFTAEDFKEQIFTFKDKPAIRIYKAPPVRNFLVHNIEGKWLYWGLVHIIEVTNDYQNKTTSGKYKIVRIYALEQMKNAHALIDQFPETDYFQTNVLS